MNNRIKARVEFSFKGETYDLISDIDLDARLSHTDHPPSFHQILARDHHIDTISYLYEVMQEEEIEFFDAQGSAVAFLHADGFDLNGFITHWHEHHLTTLLHPIAQHTLGIADLDQHPKLKAALLQAYQLGKAS